MRIRVLLATALAVTMLPAHDAGAADPRTVRIVLTTVASGLSSPVAIASPNDGSGRLMVVQQGGRIRVYKAGNILASSYLNLSGSISTGGERGLLGLAFHPNYKSNGYFYVFFTGTDGDLRISRYRASPPSANTVSTSTGVHLMRIEHSAYSNHNGGQLHFGPDGYLYISTGDGGGQGDPGNNAQDRTSRLGKILRINVNSSCGTLKYCIPSTNPYASHRTYKREIWQYGLRNPWRFSFDPSTKRLWIADVGQNAIEEINRIEPGVGGKNLGWDCREGTRTYSTASYCSGKTFYPPMKTYSHVNGRCAIIGGHVYRGSDTKFQGIYVYADYCTGEMWGLAYHNGTLLNSLMRDHSGNPTTFGESPGRNLYMADAQGRLFRVTAVRR